MSGKAKRISLVIAAIIVVVGGAIIARMIPGSQENDKMQLSVGENYHHQTVMSWKGSLADMFGSKPKRPSQYKNYPEAKKVPLPQPEYRGMTLEEAVSKRRSIRNYSDEPLDLKELSQLLYAAQGVSGKIYGTPLRTSPSAGALYPFEIYVIVNNVKDLDKGIYHFSVLDHGLELLKAGDFRSEIVAACLQQDILGKANVTFVLSAIPDRIRHKYGERGYRYIYMEAGHISQNIYLQSTSLGLGSVSVGAFFDADVNELVGVDGRNEAVMYLHAVGKI